MPDEKDQKPGRDAVVTLREITAETVREVCKLEVAEPQKRMVAPNAVSIAQAYFEPKAWFRAIYAGETMVGFVMVYDGAEEENEYFLWRYMIDQRYQHLGFGRRALELVIEHAKKTYPDLKSMLTSHSQVEGNPGPFYGKLGFKHTGEEDHGELVMKLVLRDKTP